MSRKQIVSIFILAVILMAVYIPKLLCPINTLDGAWYFSQAPSVLQGGRMFNFYTNFHTPAFYGWLQIPLATEATSILGVQIFYLVFSSILSFYLIFRLKASPLVLVLPLLILADKTILLQRPEPVTITFALVLYYIWTTCFSENKIIGIIFALFLISLHIPPGSLAVASILCYRGWLFRLNKLYICLGIFTTTAIISSCILIPDNIFPATLMFRLSRFTLATPFKFLLYSSVTLIPLLYLVKEYINRTFIINYFVLLLATLFFGAYYYMLMLFVPPILILIEHAHTIKYPKWIIAPITLNILINIVSPIYTAAENPIYCNQVNSIIAITSSIEQRLLEDPNTPKFYLESSISPSVITQGNNGRMLLFETDSMQIFDDIDAGDKIAITSARKMKLFLKHYRSSKNVTFENQELLAPVPGKLSIKSFYRKRTEPLGLWILTAKKA